MVTEGKQSLLTAEEWTRWLTDQERINRSIYVLKPQQLISDYNSEKECARDYEGREILELLQNANDAAAELRYMSRVAIELRPEGLIIANTGAPFSTVGVASLQTSHLSPKRFERRMFIGSKGLGFRAVLNWSTTPIILSGALRIAYSRTDLARKLDQMMEEKAELAFHVQQERQHEGELVIPMLPFPSFTTEDGCLGDLLDTDAARIILDRCEVLKQTGYTTVIGMPFTSPKAMERASAEIADLRPELLLFARNLGEVLIRDHGQDALCWRRDPESHNNDIVRVWVGSDQSKEWLIRRTEGQLPSELLDEVEHRVDYELVVAVPQNDNQKTFPLFSYFPTDTMLPLPVVCHATLELEQNRKHAQATAVNRFILTRLTEFLAEVAEHKAAVEADDPWAGVDLITARSDYPLELTRIGFPQNLLKAAGARKIVPTLGGQIVEAGKARLLRGASSSWLPISVFADLVRLRDPQDFKAIELHRQLGVQELGSTEFGERIRQLHDLDLPMRASLIAGMVRNGIPEEQHWPGLLLDTESQVVPEQSRVYFSPSEGSAAIPQWAEIRFLHKDLRLELEKILEIHDTRLLQAKLASFHVIEYSLDNLIRSLITATNRRVKEDSSKEAEFYKELLQTLFRIFPAHLPDYRRPKFPDEGTVRIRSQAGTFRDARKLHMGTGYPPRGQIIQDLYDAWAPDKLIVAPNELDLDDDFDKVRQFLIWMGVSSWPRETKDSKVDRGYLDYALHHISYPAKFGEYVYNAPGEIESPSLDHAKTVEDLDKILENANPYAILAWLALDERASRWRRNEPDHALIRCEPYRTSRYRYYKGPHPSYIFWKIQDTSWLPLSSGTKGRPADCIAGERVIESLFPRPERPPDDILDRYDIHPLQIREGWMRAGVISGLDSLNRDALYRLLLELPARNPDGQAAKGLYRWLLDASDLIYGSHGPAYKEFMENGKMWGHCGTTQAYYPLKELKHVDHEGFPEALLSKFKIVDLPKRVGTDKVERLFGIQSVEKGRLEQQLKHRVLALGSPAAAQDFETAKPYLARLRQTQTAQFQSLRALQAIKLEVCSEVGATIHYENQTFDYDLPVWGSLIVENILYIRSDPAQSGQIPPELLAPALGSALASLFKVGGGSDFALILMCPEENRRNLLRNLCGDSVDEDIEQLKAEFIATPEERHRKLKLPALPSSTKTSASTSSASKAAPDTPETQQDTAQTTVSHPTSDATEMIVEEQPHVQDSQPQRRRLQVTREVEPIARIVSSHHQVDGGLCERIAMEYEEAADPPRFPLLVAQIRGLDAAGCDILSFATEEARTRFNSSETKDIQLVQRFIEVKGRSQSKAKIQLKDNELNAAIEFGPRYYIYRLFQINNGEYKLTELRNPAAASEALTQVAEISMDRAQNARVYRLRWGVANDQNSEDECQGGWPACTS